MSLTVVAVVINVAKSGEGSSETCLSGNWQWTADHLGLEVELQLDDTTLLVTTQDNE